MKKQLLFIFTIFFIASAFVPVRKKEFLPPGTVKINDTLFADETEISNFSWQEYELWTKTKYGALSPEHLAVLPDTLVWRDSSAYCEPYMHYYYRHPAYANYPAVGISYEQALAYCKWRTEQVGEFMTISKKYDLMTFKYRLPSKAEWEFLSNNGAGVFSNSGFDAKKAVKANTINSCDSCKFSPDNADVTAPVFSYAKNRFNLFNMIGNVSEMVNEKGISKGGSWRHKLEQCRTGKDILYTRPASWLGFRCVCVVGKAGVRS
ncbi:MAG: SUMF1/EgtB/PvdO family nonheme iron enzyme [Bacteroidia bacterium]